jgi:hypothetical protein
MGAALAWVYGAAGYLVGVVFGVLAFVLVATGKFGGFLATGAISAAGIWLGIFAQGRIDRARRIRHARVLRAGLRPEVAAIEGRMRWIKWGFAVSFWGVAAALCGLFTAWAWREEEWDVLLALALCCALFAAAAWKVAVLGVLAERRGYVFRLDAHGLRCCGEPRVLRWKHIRRIDALEHGGRQPFWTLTFDLDREARSGWAPRKPAFAWLLPRTAALHYELGCLRVDLKFVRGEPRMIEAQALAVAERHGWTPRREWA